nr:hypothetical protein CFP56_42092 [Quercus suber]
MIAWPQRERNEHLDFDKRTFENLRLRGWCLSITECSDVLLEDLPIGPSLYLRRDLPQREVPSLKSHLILGVYRGQDGNMRMRSLPALAVDSHSVDVPGDIETYPYKLPKSQASNTHEFATLPSILKVEDLKFTFFAQALLRFDRQELLRSRQLTAHLGQAVTTVTSRHANSGSPYSFVLTLIILQIDERGPRPTGWWQFGKGQLQGRLPRMEPSAYTVSIGRKSKD